MTAQVEPVPKHMRTVTPHLVCDGAAPEVVAREEALRARL